MAQTKGKLLQELCAISTLQQDNVCYSTKENAQAKTMETLLQVKDFKHNQCHLATLFSTRSCTKTYVVVGAGLGSNLVGKQITYKQNPPPQVHDVIPSCVQT